MNYLIGDVQGCCGALDRLLADHRFLALARSHLYLLGDLVNRGPAIPGRRCAGCAAYGDARPSACSATTT